MGSLSWNESDWGLGWTNRLEPPKVQKDFCIFKIFKKDSKGKVVEVVIF